MNPTSPPGAAATIGPDLAGAVADRLFAGRVLAFSHPEYCGVGLQCQNGVFVLSEVFDGELFTVAQAAAARERGQAIEFQSFGSRDEFVAWLAAQTDDTLSGAEHSREWLRGNQRITRARLEEFIA